MFTSLKSFRILVTNPKEVDCWSFWETTLQSNGYKGIWKKRTGQKKDGCAILYKQDK